jgi:hypothetical protein
MNRDKQRHTDTTARQALPLKLFVSYSHRDELLRDRLADHLAALEREGLIAEWHDRRIGAGEDWAGMIDHNLSTADVILLLVSPSFIASHYCYDLELRHALARAAAGEARVIPIILRPVDWSSLPFGKLQALPKDGKPVTNWSNRDQAFLNIAQGIRSAVNDLDKSWEGKRTVALDEPTFLLYQQFINLKAELEKLEILGDDPMKKARLRTEIARLRELYRYKYGRDLPEDHE